MPTVREIMLARAKVPAKVHDMERRPQSHSGAGGSRCATPSGPPSPRGGGEPNHRVSPTGAPGTRPPRPKAGPSAPNSGGSGRAPPAGPRASEARRPARANSLEHPPRRTPSERPRSGDSDAQGAGSVQGGARNRPPPAAKARASSLQRVKVGDAPPPIERKDVGKVPSYLKKRQEEMAEEKRLAARPLSPQPPPGHRKVSIEERDSTLSVLKQRRAEVEKAQNSLPFKIETLGQKQREKDLQDRIAHIDKLMGLFSKPVVFVPADAGDIAACVPPLQATPTAAARAHPGDESNVPPAGAPPTARNAGPPRPRPSSRERIPQASPFEHHVDSGPKPVRTEVRVAAPPGGVSNFQFY
mmetsp:Transcript_83569/g.183742  ORF Transcript_83569/g.183742 Transcript_83569/m.183742 type:complete len:356 (-) Transcript_83569:137-1204(-)|eukprot:CAMPEP_0206532668 /NCGR_PEP_ID=MMETSP0325_2-20121206/4523_1 /ASSEMBLY_ACC=CAM_ASM_000347 /TAXON_ID=2866 /ORGANISM="Crypthecodinium cohnii, Strain Seligo" /LENGTH=355 /DNA_ID=CAMNT_0054029197 /DNA_START=94 /DNA_END=1161 /DNA_ORIENTATION=-